MEKNESAIIERCQGGDLEEFGALYDAYIRKIYSFIYYKTHHRETAEDLTSRVFMKAMKNIGTYHEKKGTFSSWLYRIARNTVIDHYRSAKHDQSLENAWGLSSGLDVEGDADTKHKIEEARKCIQKLKPHQREIILMRLWDGLTYQEIAEITGKTVANCKVIFSRSMREVREELIPLIIFFLLIITA